LASEKVGLQATDEATRMLQKVDCL
jgi:hypothetical protein